MSRKKNVEAIYPLTAAQQGMVFESLLAPESGIHVEQTVFAVPRRPDLPALERAWHEVVSRHGALRTGFLWKDGEEPLQVVLREVEERVELHDWRGLTAGEQRERRTAFLDAERRRGFKLAKPPLIRLALFHLGEDACELAWTFHHALMDGWSQSVLKRELFSLWEAFARGEELRLERPRPYQDYIRWLKRQDLARAEELWRERLREFTEPTPLGAVIEPAGAPAPAERYAVEHAYLSPLETSAVRALAQSLQVTPNALLQGVWALLLGRYSGRRDVVFGATVSGRPAELPGIESTIGLFINTLPVRIRLPERGRAADWLREIHARNLELRRFEHTPGGRIHEWSELPASAPMYESIVVVENYAPAPAPELDQGFAVRAVEAKGAQTKYALAVIVSLETRLGLHLVHDRLRLDDGDVARIAARFLALLRSLVDDPEQEVDDMLEQVPRGEIPRVRSLPRAGREMSAESAGAPRDPLATVVAEVWESVLGLPRERLHGSFFELGGHSLVAIRLLAELQKRLQIELPLRVLFEDPTVAGMAAAIREHRDRGDEQAPGQAETVPAIRPAPEELYLPFPLTDLQQAYWVGGTGAFELALSPHVYEELELEDLGPERLHGALEKLIERHPMLRAVVTADGRQQILRQVPPYRIEVLDLRGVSQEEAEAALLQVRERMSREGPPADRWPLFEVRVSRLQGRARLHLALSLLLVDGLSLPLLLEELVRLYRDPGALLEPLELSFRDYVLALAALRESAAYRRAEDYWRGRLASLPPPPELPLTRSPGSLPRHRLAHRSGTLEADLWQRLQAQAARAGVTPTVALCAAYAEVLATWSKSPRFTLNLLFSNRPPFHADMSRIFGNCSTTLLLEVDSSPGASFRVRAQRLQQQMWRDLEHSQFTGIRVLRELNRGLGGTSRAAMPVVFTSALSLWRSAAAAPVAATAPRPRVVYSAIQTPQVWLDHQVGERAGRLDFNWDAVDDLFPEGFVSLLVEAYHRRLLELARNEASWEEPARGLLPAEQLEVRARVNATAAPVSQKLLHILFEERVPERRDEPAVVAAGRTLSYGELLRLSRSLAHRLRALGARPNRLVAVVMDKGWEQVVATLAVMQAGAAYLPVDPGLPVERFHALLALGEVELALTQPALLERLKWPAGVATLAVGEDEPETEPPALAPVQEPRDLAYVIFTSGSTGLPKGVMIDHRGAVNTILDVNRRFGVGPDDRVLALSRLSFDLSVYDLFGLLAAGATVVLPESAEAREPARWVEWVARERVTVWNSVPTLMEMMVHDLESRSQALPPSLSLVLLSGDWIPVTLPARIRALGEHVRVISLGGATEASIWSICHPIDRVDPAWPSIPYGRPLDNQTVHVLDETLEPRPTWVPGQFYIGGIGLAQGYWRDEERTRASFFVHPRTGERLYRTGDLGRWLPDGTIEFLGREDFQVKVQGYRIELGEIEAALAEHPHVRAGVVAAVGEPRGQRRLVAYVVVDAPEASAPDVTAGLRAFLESKLPDYMIPSAFVRLDALPLTPNGKVDRGALPAPEERTAERAATFVAPRDETELELGLIWEEILDVRPIGVRESFFELGGHSLLAVQLMGRIRQRFAQDLPLSILFSQGTVEHLAALLRDREAAVRGSVLVPIQTAGSRPPFFCVHPVGGSVLCYADLARRLGPDQPFYGLQAPELDGDPEPSLPELAQRYVQELRQVEPEGPYRLGGWSMGGLVAFEMARQLREQGQEVALVALFDAVLPGWGAYPESADEASLSSWFDRDLAALSGQARPPDLEPVQVRRLFATFRANARALLAYVPGSYAGPVLLLRAAEELARSGPEVALAWRSVAAGLEEHVLPGNHYTLLREPQVGALAERLRSALEETREWLPAQAPAAQFKEMS